jgi:hypothetical protein
MPFPPNLSDDTFSDEALKRRKSLLDELQEQDNTFQKLLKDERVFIAPHNGNVMMKTL